MCWSYQHTQESDSRFSRRRIFQIHGPPQIHDDVYRSYGWLRLKKDMLDLVSRYLVCQLVKDKHLRPGGMLQPLPHPKWKWKCITCDFVTGLPCTRHQLDTVWMIVDWLTKLVHIISIKLHREILYDQDPRFTFTFWTSLQRELGIETKFSTLYYPQTEGHSEQTIQILEDLLKSCVLDFGSLWDEHLPLVEFPRTIVM